MGARGVAALATTLLLGGIIVEIALAGILAVTYLTSENYGVRRAAEARVAGESAMQEALIRILRNKLLPQGNLASSWNRDIDFAVGSAEARAVVCLSTLGAAHSIALGCNPASSGEEGGIYEVIATGSEFTKRYELRGLVHVDPLTGKMTIQSVREVPYDQ